MEKAIGPGSAFLFRMARPSGPCAFEELASSSFVFSKLQPSLLRNWYAKAIRPGSQFLFRMARPSGQCAHNRAGQLFRMAAYSLDRSPAPLGDYLRRMKAKIGPHAAHTATAHNIAVIFYTLVKNQVEYDPTIWEEQDTRREQRQEIRLQRQAARLGYKLTPIQEAA